MSVLFKNEHLSQQREYNGRHHVRRAGEKDKRSKEDDLLVFGYACNIFSDDEKALYFDEGKHLIPWMGDESLMIDRFDGRLLLEDLSQLVPRESSAESQLSESELEVERQCDKERYLALEENVEDTEYEEEEEMKRFKAAIASESYSAVGFSYDQYYPQYNYDTAQNLAVPGNEYYLYAEQQTVEPPVTEEPKVEESSSVVEKQEEEEIEVFVPPEELGVPEDMEVPDTAKLHVIIERTAFFIKDHGPQMEIVVKAKQSGNQQFDFLQFDHRLNPYYKLILAAVRNGTYEPVSCKPSSPSSPSPDEDDSDESDGEMELHPLLTASLRTPVASTRKPTPPVTSEQPLPPGWTAVTTESSSLQSSSLLAGGTDLSFSEIDGYSMTMPTLAGYHPDHYFHPSNLFPPPPPPPGESPPRTHDPETQTPFDTGVPNAPPGVPVLYPNNLLDPGLSYASADMSDYTVNVGPPIIPPPPDLKPICDKLAEYVARNGQEFEDNIRKKNDPRFDFLNETSDHYTYYHMRRKEFELNPPKPSQASDAGTANSGVLPPSNKPISFQIKAKDTKRTVIEYQSSVLFKTAKADESDEEEEDGEASKDGQTSKNKDTSENGQTAASQPDIQGPKTQEDVIAEERTTKLKQEKEKEVQRLEEEAKSTTSSLRRQVQLERRRRAQLFINMLKKTKPTSEVATSKQNSSDTNNIFEPAAAK